MHSKLHLLRRVIGHRLQRILNPLGLPSLSTSLFLSLNLLSLLMMPLLLQPSSALLFRVFLFLLPRSEEIHFLLDLATNTKLL